MDTASAYRLLRGGVGGASGFLQLLGVGRGTRLPRRYFSFPDRIGSRPPRNLFVLAFSSIRFFQSIPPFTLDMSSPTPGFPEQNKTALFALPSLPLHSRNSLVPKNTSPTPSNRSGAHLDVCYSTPAERAKARSLYSRRNYKFCSSLWCCCSLNCYRRS